MNYLKKSEKLLKRYLKSKRRITLSLVVAFLITGGLGFTDDEAEARDLRSRRTHNKIEIDNSHDGPKPSKGPTFNGKQEVIDIVAPGAGGISHNKFTEFNVGSEQGVIFNNNSGKTPSQTGLSGLVTENPNLKDSGSASAILTEVTGGNGSDIDGVIEIAGQKADFILANENGINVNGGGFVNTNSVTLSTGSPTITDGKISLNVTKGHVQIEGEGVGTGGDYFNIIAKTIELRGKVAAFDKQADANINLIAGKNTVKLQGGKDPNITHSDKNVSKDEKTYGIYADKLGAMYGKNIKLISTTQGLGVKHEGLIRASGNVHIDSNGNISVGAIHSDNKISIKGTGNFDSVNGVYSSNDDSTNKDKKYNFSIRANDGIEIKVEGDITLRNELVSHGVKDKKGSIIIDGKSLKLLSEGKKYNGSITSNGYLHIKVTGDITFEELLKPVFKDRDSNSAPPVVEVDDKGNIKVVDPITGKELPEDKYEWVSGGIYAQQTEIEGKNLTNNTKIESLGSYRDNKTTIKITDKLVNNNSIVTSGDLSIIANKIENKNVNEKTGLIAGAKVDIVAKDIDNEGQIRQNKISEETGTGINKRVKIVITESGKFINRGVVSGHNIEIEGTNFNLENTKTGVIIAGDAEYPHGAGNIIIKVKELKNEGMIASGNSGNENKVNITAEDLINIGKILAFKGNIDITTTIKLDNKGEIIASKEGSKDAGNVKITGDSGGLLNQAGGKIAGENVTINSNGTLTNEGIISGVQKVLIEVNKFINAGNAKELEEYLTNFYTLSEKSLADAENMLKEAEAKGEKEKVEELKKIVQGLKDLKEKLSTLKVGMVSAKEITVKTKDTLENKGIVKGETKVELDSEKTISNEGVIESKDITMKAKDAITNSNRIYAENKLDITGKSFTSTKQDDKLNEYTTNKQKYDDILKEQKISKFEDFDTKLSQLEAELKITTENGKIQELSKQIQNLRDKKKEAAALRANIIAAGFGNIEANDATISTTDKLENSGLIMVKNNLTLDAKTTGDIDNKGTIDVGNDATITGKSFKNDNMQVGGKLTAKIKENFESRLLKVKKDMEIEALHAKFTEKLDVGENATITGNVTFGNDTKEDKKDDIAINLKKNLTIKNGGLTNKLSTAIGGNLSIDKSNGKATVDAKFDNSGKLSVSGTTDIKTNDFKNTGDILTKKDMKVESSNFENSKNIVNEGKLTIKSTGKFDNKNGGNILSNGVELDATQDITNEGKLQSKGNLDITGKTKLNNKGEILVEGAGNINITDSITNEGKIAAGKSTTSNVAEENTLENGDFKIETGKFENKSNGIVQAQNKLNITFKKGFTNEDKGNILGGKDITLDGSSNTLTDDFKNSGNIISNGTLKVDLGTNQKDIDLQSSGKLASKDILTLITGGNITNEGRFQNEGALNFDAGKNITNKGMLASLGDIILKAKGNIINGDDNTKQGATIWSNKNIKLEAEKDISNFEGSTIESKENMNIKAENGTLLNKGGTITAGGELDIKAKNVKNESIIEKNNVQINMSRPYEIHYQINSSENKWISIQYYVPQISTSGQIGKKATIQGKKGVNIEGEEKIHNLAGTIVSGTNMNLKSKNIKNESGISTLSLEEILKHAKIQAWELTYQYGNKPGVGNPTNKIPIVNGDIHNNIEILIKNPILFNILKQFTGNTDQEYQTKKLLTYLNVALNGKINSNGNPTINDYNPQKTQDFHIANSGAKILSAGKMKIEGGKIENIGGSEHKENTNVEITLGNGETIDGTTSNLDIVVEDPNKVTEANGIKYPSNVDIQSGSVTINGITITGNGGTVGGIAVAGTVNPIIYIEIPKGENGIFKPATPQPGQRVPYKFETNLDFIDLGKYYGSKYFFDKVGYKGETTVIGDAYYEKELINKVIRESLGYAGEVTADNIKHMLDNAADIQNDLGLEIGKPLTPDQINKLEKDIVWYVEMEMDGEKVLVPQVYFSKDTRLQIAQGNNANNGPGANISAGGNLDIKGGSLDNINGNITAGGNVNVDVSGDIKNDAHGGYQGGITSGGDTNLKAGNDIEMQGGSVKAEGNVNLEAEGNIDIESGLGYDEKGNQKVSNQAGIEAKGDIKVNAKKDVNITNGNIESETGNVTIGGDNVNIKDQNLISSESKQEGSGWNSSSYNKVESKSHGSTIAGNNVTINSEKDTNVQGSNVVAKNDVNINAGGDLNITDGKDVSYETSSSKKFGIGEGGLNIGTSSSETTQVKSKKSTVGGLGGVNVKTGGDVTLKGSDMISGEGGINIESKGDVNIIDGQDKVYGNSHSEGFSGITYSKNDNEYKQTTSKGSSLTSKGNINIKTDGSVKSVGSEINSLGDTKIEAKKDVTFEAGKNTYEEKSSSINVGLTNAGASAGAGGASAGAYWDPTNGGSTDVVTGKPIELSKQQQIMGNSKGGKNYMDALTQAHTEVGVSVKNSEKKGTTWTEGGVTTGGKLDIKAGGTADIGGADFSTGGDFNIEADQIESKKYEDVHEEKNDEFSLGVKVGNTTTSNIADAVNKGMQMDETVKDPNKSLNGALTGAQVGGMVSNAIFGDLVGNTTSVTGELKVKNEASKITTENTTNIESKGNINFKTNKGDINLNGVEMKGNDITLDSAKDVNIKSAKNSEKSNSIEFGASGGITGNVGVGALDGAYAQAGITGNTSFKKNDKNNQTNTGSSITGNNITIKSKGDTNIKGGKVEGNNVSLDVDGKLNIETEKDKIDESRIEGFAGLDVSAGGSSTTIATGDIGVSAGGGQIFKKGDKINDQSGIIANNSLNANVKGDVNLKGGALGSETGNGSLNVGGNLNVEDMKSGYEEGGAIIGGNGGTKGFGVQGEVGDVVNQQKTSKGTIGLNGNAKVDGDITVNGNKDNNLDNVNKDVNNGLTVDRDDHQNGGTFGITGSAIPGKKGTAKKNNDDGPAAKVPEFKIPRPEIKKQPTTDPVPSPTPEFKIPRPDVVVPDQAPPTVTAKKEQPQPPKSDIVDGKKPIPEQPQPSKPDTGGYVKNPETGKWEPANGGNGGLPGAKTTNGSFGSKDAVDGFQKGIKGESNEPKPPVKPPVTEGSYVKNPETGKWEPANGGNGGLPGAKTTNGSFGSKDAVDGFQKGIKGESNEPKPPVKPPVTEGSYVKDPTTGKWVPANGGNTVTGGTTKGDVKVPTKPDGGTTNKGSQVDGNNGGYVKNPETGKWEPANGGNKGPQGAITTNGPFGSKGSLDGFRDGVDSLNKPGRPSGEGNVNNNRPTSDKGTSGIGTGSQGNKGTESGGVTTPTKGQQGSETNGGYVKNPETGKWEPANGGNKGPQGAITTNGPFGSKGSLDGFRDGVDSLNKPGRPSGEGSVTPNRPTSDKGTSGIGISSQGNKGTESGGVTTSTKGQQGSETNGGYVKNPETGKWEPANGGNKGPQGVKATNGFFGSKQAVDGFQKGVNNLNNKGNSTTTSKDGDKYSVLDKDNPFDFPQDDGVRVDITDRAGEKQIVPEHYEPLNALPPERGNNNQSSIRDRASLEKKLGELLEQQKMLSDKPILTTTQKARLNLLEKEMKNILKALNDTHPELPPADYNIGVNGREDLPPLPPADYNTGVNVGDNLPPLPPADYNTDANGREDLPPLPPADYDKTDGIGGKKYPTTITNKKPNKKVQFNDEVEVKYINDKSTKSEQGASELLNDIK